MKLGKVYVNKNNVAYIRSRFVGEGKAGWNPSNLQKDPDHSVIVFTGGCEMPVKMALDDLDKALDL